MNYLGSFIRVTCALMIREIASRFGNRPGGYLWAFFEPVAYIAMMSALFGVVARVPPLERSFPMFFATGYISYHFFRGLITYATAAVTANKGLLNYPNVAPIDTVASRVIVQTATHGVVAVLVLGVLHAHMWAPPPIDFLSLAEAVAMAVLLGTGVTLFNIPMTLRFSAYDRVFAMIMRPLFFISAVFYLPEGMPHPFRDFLFWNPIVHIIMLFRKGFYPQYIALDLDTGFVWKVTIATLAIGMLAFTAHRDILRNRFEK